MRMLVNRKNTLKKHSKYNVHLKPTISTILNRDTKEAFLIKFWRKTRLIIIT